MAQLKLNKYGKFSISMNKNTPAYATGYKLAKAINYPLIENDESEIANLSYKSDTSVKVKRKDFRLPFIPFCTQWGTSNVPFYSLCYGTSTNHTFSQWEYMPAQRQVIFNGTFDPSLFKTSSSVNYLKVCVPFIVLSSDDKDLESEEQYTFDTSKVIPASLTSYTDKMRIVESGVEYLKNPNFTDYKYDENAENTVVIGYRFYIIYDNTTNEDKTVNSLYLCNSLITSATDTYDNRAYVTIANGHKDDCYYVVSNNGYRVGVGGSTTDPYIFDASILLGVVKLDSPVTIKSGDSKKFTIDVKFENAI